ncbi:hypothetical protein BGX27_007952 [Mortierella sp. AM989]|nr:hypothetical protein BGX27_007952 [Mortierella sp. AM989]
MSTLQSSAMSYAELSKRDSSLGRPRLYLADSIDNESDLEDMMTDSAIAGTPPLDLEFDSGDDCDDTDDSEPLMRSPVSLPSVQPVSILQSKRKDSQEHGSAIHLLDRNQQDLGHAPAPDNYSKGGRGRRPTVTFNLDIDEPSSSPPAKLNFHRPTQFRHDDTADDSDPEGQEAETKDSIHHTEQALRRVSISLAEDNDQVNVAQSVLEQEQEHAPLNSNTTTNAEINPPQETILNHILNEAAPQDMLVALFERPSELQALVARHSDFFNLMYSSLSKASRDEFKKILFEPRESLSDRDWMQAIAERLDSLPCILEKFKDIVGWIGPDSEDDDENVLWGEDEYGCRDSSFEQVQIKWLRDIEDFPLETFQEYYPQFFINARERLEGRRMSHGGDQRDQYVIFCETLSLTREALPCDGAWMRRMNGCLEKHPELLLQLKEIIAYEVEYDA